jgi:hypothetical protein
VGTVREPPPVKAMASILAAGPGQIERVKAQLVVRLDESDWASALLPFDHTDYYAAEFGPGLVRQIVTFRRLISPVDLVGIKRLTNELEQELAHVGRRAANIDPGYVSLGKLVLATTKDHAHRLYLGQGIYGEVTLTYQRGGFRPWPWTYPDYASDEYCALFGEVRERYKMQMREIDP